MKFKYIINLFKTGNVCVFGAKGSGKDLIMGNVVVRRDLDYVSNIDYGSKYHEFVLSDFDCGGNYYKNFLSGNINQYVFPFPDKTDLYLSDCGVYFPCQYNGELNRDFRYFPTYMGLSRHLADGAVHLNTQYLGRPWDKLREQSEIFIYCRRCIYVKLFNIVIQFVRIYDQYESALKKVRPFSVRAPLICTRQTRINVQLQRDNYLAAHGEIKSGVLIYRNRSTYDTRFFKKLLEGGVKPCVDS